jgi:hypothetical protein
LDENQTDFHEIEPNPSKDKMLNEQETKNISEKSSIGRETNYTE